VYAIINNPCAFFSCAADAGPLDQIQDAPSDDDGDLLPPGAGAAAGGGPALPGARGTGAPAARTRCVSLSPTGRAWAAATTEGVLLYSLDESLVFDPTDLAEDVTPAAVLRALGSGAYLRALLVALRLRDPALLRHVLLSTPPPSVGLVAATLPPAAAPALLGALGEALGASPHVEHVLRWAQAVCARHGAAAAAAPGGAAPALRALHKALAGLQEDLGGAAEGNLYALRYLCAAGQDGEGAAAGAEEVAA
jgi:periodic tryptophan protein 2